MLLKEVTLNHIETYDIGVLLKNLDTKVILTMDFLTLFIERFENNKVIKPKYTFKDKITLSKEQTEKFMISETTIGRLIFNAFCLPEIYFKQYGFVNSTINKSINDKIHTNLSLLLSDNLIDSDDYSDTIDRLTWLGMNMTNFRGLCMDYDSIVMSDKFIDMKNKVYDELKNKKATGDEILAAEDILINEALKEKKHTGLARIISSGSKGSFTNNYKVLNIGRGITKNGSGDLVLLNRSLSEGNKPSDYVQLSNNSILGSFGRSLKTAQGGYLTKLVTAGFSYLTIDKEIKDCGTKGFLNIKLTDSNIKEYLHRNVRLSGRSEWQPLSLKNYKDFIGKNVEMRSPMYCKSENSICPACFGTLFERSKLDTGLNVIIADLTSKIMNTSMKSMASAYSDICIKQCELSGKLSA